MLKIINLTRYLFFIPVLFSFQTKSFAITDQIPLFVKPAWLVEHLSDSNLVILDTRPRADYQLGHILGAVNLPVAKTFNPHPPTDRLGPPDYIKKLFGDAGIDKDSQVVIYDNGQFKWAARVLWALHVYGHQRASLLTVDYNKWNNSELPVSGVTEIPQPKTFIPRLQPQWITTKLHTLLAIDNDKVTLLDVRTAEEFRGEKSKSHFYGHIPTAINIDWKDMADQQGKTFHLKTIDGLHTILSAIEGSKKIITYCNKGHEASLAYVALRSLGHNVAVYDGSWFEWGNTSTLPINNPNNTPAPQKHVQQ